MILVCAKPVTPGLTTSALPVLGDLLDQPVEEGRASPGRGPTHAHVAAEHVVELRHLVDVRQPGSLPHHRHLLLGAPAELLPVDVAQSPLSSPLSVRSLNMVKTRPALPTRSPR